MRRIGISALVTGLFIIIAGLDAAADPLAIDPDAYAASQRWYRSAAPATASNPAPAGRGLFGDAARPQTAAAQPQSGGGFLGFLFGRAPSPLGPPRFFQRAQDYYQPPSATYQPSPSTYQPAPPSYQPPRGLFALFAPPAYQQAAAPQPPGATGDPSQYFVPSSYGDLAHQPVDPKYDRQVVAYDGAEAPGTIVVDTPNKFLYLVGSGGRAMRYGIGVGKPGFAWAGTKTITAKREWPDWRPPEEMLERRPDLPRFMAGGPDNPLGARAMYLGSTLYRIHGSNEPWTIGTNVSSGCIRMRNEDVIDLYDRVKVGTKVVVI